MARILIVEEALKNRSGHWYEYNRAIVEEARERGHKVFGGERSWLCAALLAEQPRVWCSIVRTVASAVDGAHGSAFIGSIRVA